MDRLTRVLESGSSYVVDDAEVEHGSNGYSGEAIAKLAKFENFYDDLVARQNEIAREMERLRSEDKTRTVKFRQLLGNKMINSNTIILLESYGLK